MNLTSETLAWLAAGRPVQARLQAERPDHNRWLVFYPASPRSPAPRRYSVIRYEVEDRLDRPLQVGRDNSCDFEVFYVEGIEGLEGAIGQLASRSPTFAPFVPSSLVIRNEPGNWRIEMDGRLLASAADRPHALSFVCAAAQQFYEFDGIVPTITCLENGVERVLRWEPDHDFLDEPDD